MVSVKEQSQCHSKSALLAYRFQSCEAEPDASALVARNRCELPEEYQMDMLLRECFVKAVCKSWAHEHGSRKEGVVIFTPLKGTRVYTDHMRPNRPEGSSLDVKVSSFRTLRNFLEQLQVEGLLTLQPGLSDPVVKKIHYDHPDFGLDLPEPKKKAVSLTAMTLQLRPLTWSKATTQKRSTVSDTVSTASDISAAETLSDAASMVKASSEVSSCETVERTTSSSSANPPATLGSCSRTRKTLGDFVTERSWDLTETEGWGVEVPLKVKAKELVHITKVDRDGWAKGVSLDTNKRGWLPAELLKRKIHVISELHPTQRAGYISLDVLDRVAVFHRQDQWSFGAKLKRAGNGTVDEEQVIEEGWFKSCCTD